MAETAAQAQKALDFLLGLVNPYGIRVTSTTGGRHNVGSKHGSGRAIDIDHSWLIKHPKEMQQIKSALFSVGGRFLDETSRPPGQKVWGGSHYHLEVPDAFVTPGLKPTPAPGIGMANTPQMPVMPAFTPPPPVQANPESLSNYLNQPQFTLTEFSKPLVGQGLGASIQPAPTFSTDPGIPLVANVKPLAPLPVASPTVSTAPVVMDNPVQPFITQQNAHINSLIEANKQAAQKPTGWGALVAPAVNFAKDLRNEQLAQTHSELNPIPEQAGIRDDIIRLGGAILPRVGAYATGALGGGLVGSIAPGIGNAVGATAGGIASGAAYETLAGKAQQERENRLAGEPDKGLNFGRLATAALMGGLGNVIIPGGKATAELGRQTLRQAGKHLLKQAAIQGGYDALVNTAQYATDEALAGRKVDLGTAAQQAVMGLAFGGIIGPAGDAIGGFKAGRARKAQYETKAALRETQLQTRAQNAAQVQATRELLGLPPIPDAPITQSITPSGAQPTTLGGLIQHPSAEARTGEAPQLILPGSEGKSLITPSTQLADAGLTEGNAVRSLGFEPEVTESGLVIGKTAKPVADGPLPQLLDTSGRPIETPIRKPLEVKPERSPKRPYLIKTNSDQIDYGRTPEVVGDLPIRMERGQGDYYGYTHIKRKESRIIDAGFKNEDGTADIKGFVEHVSRNYTHAYQKSDGKLILVESPTRFIEVVKKVSRQGDEYYGVTTAFPGDEKYLASIAKKEALVWKRSEPSSAPTEQGAPTFRSGLEESSVSNPAGAHGQTKAITNNSTPSQPFQDAPEITRYADAADGTPHKTIANRAKEQGYDIDEIRNANAQKAYIDQQIASKKAELEARRKAEANSLTVEQRAQRVLDDVKDVPDASGHTSKKSYQDAYADGAYTKTELGHLYDLQKAADPNAKTPGLKNINEIEDIFGMLELSRKRTEYSQRTSAVESDNPNLAELARAEIDPATGMGRQIEREGMLRPDSPEVKAWEARQEAKQRSLKGSNESIFTDPVAIKNKIDEAITNDQKLSSNYRAQNVGARQGDYGRARTGEDAITPIGYTLTKDGRLLVEAYNSDGHLARYHIDDLEGVTMADVADDINALKTYTKNLKLFRDGNEPTNLQLALREIDKGVKAIESGTTLDTTRLKELAGNAAANKLKAVESKFNQGGSGFLAVPEVVNTAGFRGTIANVTKGVRDFNPDDILNRSLDNLTTVKDVDIQASLKSYYSAGQEVINSLPERLRGMVKEGKWKPRTAQSVMRELSIMSDKQFKQVKDALGDLC